MILEPSPTGHTSCKACLKFIEKGSLRVTKKGFYCSTKYYHLDCFRPDNLAPVTARFFTLKKVDPEAVAAWVESWNKQFITSEDKVPQQFLGKAVHTVPTAARRRLIETFAFLTVKEVETAAARTCKEWFHVTRDQELWKSRFLRQFNPADTEAEGDYRRKYIAYYNGACFGCGEIISQEQIARKCALYNRLICRKCCVLPEFRVVSLNRFTEQTFVTPATLKALEVPVFTHDKARSSYLKLLKEKVVPYAERRMQRLLELLRASGRVTKEEIEAIAAVDIDAFYGTDGLSHYRTPKPVIQAFVFCGKCEKGEKVEKNVEAFLQMVEKFRGFR